MRVGMDMGMRVGMRVGVRVGVGVDMRVGVGVDTGMERPGWRRRGAARRLARSTSFSTATEGPAIAASGRLAR